MFAQEKKVNCFSINLAVLCCLMILCVEGVPPSMCFENFNHNDCGIYPTPVFYHYKPGSRCEVGFWRGCKPNLNMFQSLEDCVMTCIFAPKAHAQLYHLIDKYYKRTMGFASEERYREKPWLNEENVDTDASEEHGSSEKHEIEKTGENKDNEVRKEIDGPGGGEGLPKKGDEGGARERDEGGAREGDKGGVKEGDKGAKEGGEEEGEEGAKEGEIGEAKEGEEE